MLNQEGVNSVGRLLWMNPSERVFAVLDGASIPDLLDRLYGSTRPEFECLYRGSLEEDMAEVAPYVVALERGTAFADWVIASGWGNHWGVFAVARIELRRARDHFWPLTIAYDPAGVPRRFRYYDPRVLRTFLPTCDSAQTDDMFGPLDRFVVEDHLPQNALVFARAGSEIQVGTHQIVRSP